MPTKVREAVDIRIGEMNHYVVTVYATVDGENDTVPIRLKCTSGDDATYVWMPIKTAIRVMDELAAAISWARDNGALEE